MTARYLGMNRTTGESISDVEHISQSIGDILRTPVGSASCAVNTARCCRR